jgi:hypothetical protein
MIFQVDCFSRKDKDTSNARSGAGGGIRTLLNLSLDGMVLVGIDVHAKTAVPSVEAKIEVGPTETTLFSGLESEGRLVLVRMHHGHRDGYTARVDAVLSLVDSHALRLHIDWPTDIAEHFFDKTKDPLENCVPLPKYYRRLSSSMPPTPGERSGPTFAASEPQTREKRDYTSLGHSLREIDVVPSNNVTLDYLCNSSLINNPKLFCSSVLIIITQQARPQLSLLGTAITFFPPLKPFAHGNYLGPWTNSLLHSLNSSEAFAAT